MSIYIVLLSRKSLMHWYPQHACDIWVILLWLVLHQWRWTNQNCWMRRKASVCRRHMAYENTRRKRRAVGSRVWLIFLFSAFILFYAPFLSNPLRQWVAVASAGPYASLYCVPDRLPPATTQFFTGRMPFLPPNQQRQSTEGSKVTV